MGDTPERDVRIDGHDHIAGAGREEGERDTAEVPHVEPGTVGDEAEHEVERLLRDRRHSQVLLVGSGSDGRGDECLVVDRTRVVPAAWAGGDRVVSRRALRAQLVVLSCLSPRDDPVWREPRDGPGHQLHSSNVIRRRTAIPKVCRGVRRHGDRALEMPPPRLHSRRPKELHAAECFRRRPGLRRRTRGHGTTRRARTVRRAARRSRSSSSTMAPSTPPPTSSTRGSAPPVIRSSGSCAGVERGGPNAARNVGLGLATCELVLFCDGDDVVDDRWATTMIEAFRPGTILAGRYLRLGGNLAEPGDWLLRTGAMFGWAFAPGGNLGVDRSLALSIGGFDESIKLGGTEVEFCIRAAERERGMVRVDDAIVNYRPPGGMTGNFSPPPSGVNAATPTSSNVTVRGSLAEDAPRIRGSRGGSARARNGCAPEGPSWTISRSRSAGCWASCTGRRTTASEHRARHSWRRPTVRVETEDRPVGRHRRDLDGSRDGAAAERPLDALGSTIWRNHHSPSRQKTTCRPETSSPATSPRASSHADSATPSTTSETNTDSGTTVPDAVR